jgi:hypothetical protein
MQATIETNLLTAEGIIRGADASTRKLHVLVDDEQMIFDVPATCRIRLGESEVGLRQLTSLDHVQISYEELSDINVAHSIGASWFPLSSEEK